MSDLEAPACPRGGGIVYQTRNRVNESNDKCIVKSVSLSQNNITRVARPCNKQEAKSAFRQVLSKYICSWNDKNWLSDFEAPASPRGGRGMVCQTRNRVNECSDNSC